MTYDETMAMLNELCDELPEAFFRELNGGIVLCEEAKRQDKVVGPTLYIMGEYCRQSYLGRQIKIYYGSFLAVFGAASPARWKEELRKTLRHEFRHHMEGLSNLKDLEIEDELDLIQYQRDYYEREQRLKAAREAAANAEADERSADSNADSSAGPL